MNSLSRPSPLLLTPPFLLFLTPPTLGTIPLPKPSHHAPTQPTTPLLNLSKTKTQKTHLRVAANGVTFNITHLCSVPPSKPYNLTFKFLAIYNPHLHLPKPTQPLSSPMIQTPRLTRGSTIAVPRTMSPMISQTSHYIISTMALMKLSFVMAQHRHIVDTGLALLSHSFMPIHYWPYAFLTATYLINGLPTPTLNHSSPYRKLFGSYPNYTFLHNFGSRWYPWLCPYSSHKLDPQSIASVFVGYSPTQQAYLCLDPTTNRTYSSRHVRFLDLVYLFCPSPKSTAKPIMPTSSEWCDFTIPLRTLPPTPTPPSDSTPTPPLTLSNPTPSHDMTTPTFTFSENSTIPPPPKHYHATRASHNIFKPITKLNLSAHLSPTKPATYKQALKVPV